MGKRRSLCEPGLPAGTKARLRRIRHRHALGNDTGMFLRYEQGLAHGPRDFFANPASADPTPIVSLAVEGGFNGVARQVGNAEGFSSDVAGEVSLVLKLNGRTELPAADAPRSPLNASVRNAVRRGADAVGCTLYVGSSRQAEDFAQFRTVREDAQAYGMPIVVWDYPHGSAVSAGGQHSFYAVGYTARTAAELGGDIVKANLPDPTATAGVPAPYNRTVPTEQHVDAVVLSAGYDALMAFSGGEKAADDAVLTRTRRPMDAGATGVIHRRHVWQRDHDAPLHFLERLRAVLSCYPSGPAVSL